MNQKEHDQIACRLARNFLLEIEGVTPPLLEKYLRGMEVTARPQSVEEILFHLLEAAQNANSKAKVIGGAIGGVRKLDTVLYHFNPSEILNSYPNWETVFERIKQDVKPKGKMRKEPRSLWPSYCKTILSSAQFMEQFSSASDFYKWVDFFDADERARPALPLLLAQQVTGIGFTLACEFFKELGYVNFGKPDVHIKDIFAALSLCSEKASDYEMFGALVRIARHVETTPYHIDKLFWLIGSGRFYYDPQIGKNGETGSHKSKFIQQAQSHMNSGDASDDA